MLVDVTILSDPWKVYKMPEKYCVGQTVYRKDYYMGQLRLQSYVITAKRQPSQTPEFYGLQSNNTSEVLYYKETELYSWEEAQEIVLDQLKSYIRWLKQEMSLPCFENTVMDAVIGVVYQNEQQ